MKIKEKKQRDEYLELARELINTWKVKVTVIPIVIGALGTVPKVLVKGMELVEIGGRIETIQTSPLINEKRLGSLRRVFVTQTPVKNHQLTLQ